MTVRVSDPFGLVELGRSFRTHGAAHRHPAHRARCPPIPLGGAWTGSGDNRPRAFATGSAEDVTVREYRRGDDLRRVHWRSSARVGELMVRREEQPWQSRATLFLDNRLRAHRGQGIASSLEAAVSAAASIAVHLSHRGFTVRLVTATGEDPSSAWHFRDADLNTGPLLEALAVVQAVHQPQPRHRLARPRAATAASPSRVFGSVEADGPAGAAPDAATTPARRWRSPSTSTPGSRPRAGAAAAPPPVLAQQGWRAVAAAARATGSTASGRSSAAAARTLPGPAAAAGRPPRRRSRPDDRAPRAASRADARRSPAAAAATTWVAMWSWRGFTTRAGPVPRPAARCSASWWPAPGALARWWRLPGAGGRRRSRCVVSGLVASTMLQRLPAARSERAWDRLLDAFADAVDTARAVRRAGAGRRARASHPLLIPGGLACLLLVDAAGLHAAPGAAGRPAAAHDLQRPGQPARRRRLLVGLRAHRGRLPDAAVPPGERAGRPLGPPARGRTRPRSTRGGFGGRHRRGPRPRAGADRRRRDRARGRPAGADPDPRACTCSTSARVRAAAPTSRSRTR